MPVLPTYPGVYIEELDSGVRTITGVATSITAFIGYTARGVLNKAVRIGSFGDFQRNFGGLNRDSLISYSVQQFFLNGGTDAYIIRIANSAQAAQIKIGTLDSKPSLIFSAASEGAWGNSVRFTIDYATSSPDSTFNLTVYRYDKRLDGTEVIAETETFRNLSMNGQSANYAPAVVSSSKMISVTRDSTLNFTQKGYSLSNDLTTFPTTITAQTNVVSGVLDGTTPFTLVLTSIPTAIDNLVAALQTAIIAAGLNGKLQASQSKADGQDDAAGTFVKLESMTPGETSAVSISAAPINDLARLLGLGGHEKDGTSNYRPAPNGTVTTTFLTQPGSGDFTLKVTDQASTNVLLPNQTLTITANEAKTESTLATSIQGRINIIDQAKGKINVALDGGMLRLTPIGSLPNASVTVTDTAHGSYIENVQQYSLGVGPTFTAQSGAVAGVDGTPPGSTDGLLIIGDEDAKTGIYALLDIDLFNLLCIPETTHMDDNTAKAVISTAVAFCETHRAFYLVDAPNLTKTAINAWADPIQSRNAAVYYPQVQIPDPLNNFRLRNFPPSGTIAGVFARIDATRGVWKAPAGTEAVLNNVQGLYYKLTDAENGVLNQQGVNGLRTFPVYSTVVWGARTRRGADALTDDYKYIPVRRLALMIEESLFRGTQWAVFEPNDEPLWSQIRLNLGAFMNSLYRQGAFQGKSSREAYFVKCDSETTIQNDIDQGIVNILVGFAPLKPAEFVIIQIQQIAGQIAS